jgi:hypothetical protein
VRGAAAGLTAAAGAAGAAAAGAAAAAAGVVGCASVGLGLFEVLMGGCCFGLGGTVVHTQCMYHSCVLSPQHTPVHVQFATRRTAGSCLHEQQRAWPNHVCGQIGRVAHAPLPVLCEAHTLLPCAENLNGYFWLWVKNQVCNRTCCGDSMMGLGFRRKPRWCD